MRILLLAPYAPYPPRSGGALRIYHLLKGLASNHEVWLLTFVSPVPPDSPDSAVSAGGPVDPDAAARALEPLQAWCRVVTVPGQPPRSLARRAWTTLASPLPDMALRNRSPAYHRALHQLLATHPFDVVQAESIEMAGYALEAAPPAPSSAPLRLLDEFNAEYVLQRRAALTDLSTILRIKVRNLKTFTSAPYSLVQWYKLAVYERQLLQHVDRVVAVSEEDRTALLRLCPRARVSIVPNGVDTDYFAPGAGAPLLRSTCSEGADQQFPDQQAAPAAGDIVFTGSLDFRPNIDAVTWFVHEVLPLVRQAWPAVRFVVVGRNPTPAVRLLHHGTSVEVVGEVADVRPFIARARVYVVPMRIGGGVRLKLLEALAMQAPVVSTTMGAEGVQGVRDGEHLLLANPAEAFARAVLRVLADPPLGQRLGEAGRKLVQERYDWRVLVPLLEAVYTSG
jgi:polysaccharide biosynthesis protein PslH